MIYTFVAENQNVTVFCFVFCPVLFIAHVEFKYSCKTFRDNVMVDEREKDRTLSQETGMFPT